MMKMMRWNPYKEKESEHALSFSFGELSFSVGF